MPADQIGAMAYSRLVPALIDPPGPYAPLEEGILFRDSLARLDVPGLRPFIREADRNIAHLTTHPPTHLRHPDK
jgi:hypothetical protein